MAEFNEDESQLDGRPALQAAINLCQKLNATLIIASTEAIGHGPPFYPRIASVPVIKLPPPERPVGNTKPAPLNAPSGLSLYFDNHAEQRVVDVYLCNGSDHPVTSVALQVVNASLDFTTCTLPINTTPRKGVYVTTTETKHVNQLPAKTACLITNYDILIDGDFLLISQMQWVIPNGAMVAGRAIVDKGHSAKGFVRFSIDNSA
ncbi:MAG: hypothetical protein BGO65_07665 [Afipia sp. 64-13]|nr:MAG: hypothetical protein BGO65_07665 [Afipia sp. 64-13]